jgi:sulfofructose kinase
MHRGLVHSTIVVGQDCGSRNVFFEDKGIIGAHDSLPDEKVIRRSKVLFIDHSGMCGNLRAARIARSAGISVVADFEDDASPLFREVLGLVDHLLLSEEFALQTTRKSDASEAALALWRPDRVAVLVTCGAKGCWSVSAEAVGQAILHPAFTVSAIDTTGCGDVFHGAYSASLARGAGLSERIRFASAAAALRAKEGEIPRRSAVETFLVSHL